MDEEIHTLRPDQNLHLTQHTFVCFTERNPEENAWKKPKYLEKTYICSRRTYNLHTEETPAQFQLWGFLAVKEQCCTTNWLTVHLSFSPTFAQIQQHWQVYNKFLNFPDKLDCHKKPWSCCSIIQFQWRKNKSNWCGVSFFSPSQNGPFR